MNTFPAQFFLTWPVNHVIYRCLCGRWKIFLYLLFLIIHSQVIKQLITKIILINYIILSVHSFHNFFMNFKKIGSSLNNYLFVDSLLPFTTTGLFFIVPFLRRLFFFEMKFGDFTTRLATGILGLLNSSGFFTLKQN